MTRTRTLVALSYAGLSALAGCDDASPAKQQPVLVRREVAPPPAEGEPFDADTSSSSELERAAPPAPRPPQPDRTCAADVTLALGNTYSKLSCLPHLDAIHYWQAADGWAAYDATPVEVALLDLSFIVDHPDITKAVGFTWNFLKEGCTSFDAAKGQCHDVAPLVPEPPPAAAYGEEQIKLVHGTMLAGLIAGRGEPGVGVVGVNPSARLDLLVRDLNSDNLASLRYAVGRGVDVISMSWPLGTLDGEKDVPEFKELLEAATQQGTVIVMAAGNSRVDVDEKPVYPTRYSTIPGVIAVGSVDPKGDFYAQFSNYGPEYVDLGAPGMAASAGGDFSGGRYSVQIGSSYSGPIVAGAVSRIIQYLKAKNVPYTAADVERLLLDGSPKDPDLARFFRDGRHLDMAALLAHVSRVHP